MSELDNYLQFAKQLALDAGQIMSQTFLDGPLRQWKSDKTPVTVADTKINQLVIDKISQKYPSHSVWGEEGDHNLGAEYTWVCDPVDGTMPFSHGLPISTFLLALTRNGKPIIGVAYDPFMKRLFWAAKGQGAFLNSKPIQVNDKTNLNNALIDVEGFSDPAKMVIKSGSKIFDDLKAAGAYSVNLWSVGLPTLLVASGEFTATIFNVSKPEDGAAAKIIVEEAGVNLPTYMVKSNVMTSQQEVLLLVMAQSTISYFKLSKII